MELNWLCFLNMTGIILLFRNLLYGWKWWRHISKK